MANQNTYKIETKNNHEFIKCLNCGSRSFHPVDIDRKYCSKCNIFHETGMARKPEDSRIVKEEKMEKSKEGFGLSDPQPAPEGGGVLVWDAVINDMLSRIYEDSKEINELIIRDMRQRDQFGFSKYGVRLQSHNGRDSFVDAYQELLDYIVYLKQCEVEGKPRRYLYETAIVMAIKMRHEIAGDRAVKICKESEDKKREDKNRKRIKK